MTIICAINPYEQSIDWHIGFCINMHSNHARLMATYNDWMNSMYSLLR
jgi:hypothetical protein